MKTITQVVQNLVKPYIDNQDQAVESNIAPVETDATSSTGSYSQGEQLILNKILYDVTAAITVGDPLEVGTNIAVAPKISAAIGGKQEQIEVSSMPTASASNVGKVLIYIGATTSTYTSGQSYQSTLEDGNYIWKPTSISSVDASDVVYDNQTSGLTATDSQAAIDELASQNQTLTNNVSVLAENGAVNLLPNNAVTKTINGITFTVNSDGTVTLNGTATATTEFPLYTNTDGSPQLVGKPVKMSGCPSGGGSSTYRLQAYRVAAADGSTGTVSDDGDGVEFRWLNNGSGTKAVVKILVYSGQTVSNLTFKPMITVPSYNGDYVPYAKSNRELTDIVTTPFKIAKTDCYCENDTAIHYYTPTAIAGYKPIGIVGISAINDLTATDLYECRLYPSGDGSRIQLGWKTALATTKGVRLMILYVSETSGLSYVSW